VAIRDGPNLLSVPAASLSSSALRSRTRAAGVGRPPCARFDPCAHLVVRRQPGQPASQARLTTAKILFSVVSCMLRDASIFASTCDSPGKLAAILYASVLSRGSTASRRAPPGMKGTAG
jgi:hypothetical protein